MTHPRRVQILGVAIDDVIEAEAVTRIAAMLESGGAHQICTVNPEFINEAARNPCFAEVLAQADLCTADGIGVLLAARYLGTPLRGRVTGVRLTHRLAQLAAERGYRLFLLGAAPGVAEEAAAVLQAAYAGLTIVGCVAGSPAPHHEPFLQQVIRSARPDILLVAYGHPKQDLWIARNQPILQVPVAVGVGGVFDYLAGRVPFAPAWVRQLGLEWLYRLVSQPRRWRRIIDAVPYFCWRVMSTAYRLEGANPRMFTEYPDVTDDRRKDRRATPTTRKSPDR
ncbi:WecB/TagA/CpsF family glycosyltransferase [Candidatus Chloroploca asiatica]|uniref:WecB/TagA/CpsF family glycosyltransferase n=1 Tax=Candidatus Chloroploca asiatica TaxID=1506545 RepID=UPI001FE57139|nr:WecB/TagA/CpsF family glycosyltransferase [Candidatus Chloroploca asiatica]